MTTLIICPGFHPPELTQAFLAGLPRSPQTTLVFPADRLPPYSPLHLLEFLAQQLSPQELSHQSRSQPIAMMPPLVWLGFSAGVVGAIGAARQWRRQGGQVRALVAIDGWGVPLAGDFPLYRVSHDRFTHWSSGLLGAGDAGFYAEPAVSHWQLWAAPQKAWGVVQRSIPAAVSGADRRFLERKNSLAGAVNEGHGIFDHPHSGESSIVMTAAAFIHTLLDDAGCFTG